MPTSTHRGQGARPARHCEAPVSLRYVGCYRREAIQCRGDNIRPTSYVLRPYVSETTTSTLDCFAAYQWYVSQVRWRLRNDGGRRFADTLAGRSYDTWGVADTWAGARDDVGIVPYRIARV
ncbi:MAG: hypothetical protein LBM98_02875 [Oscillospiraceae bacterium]|nr:hypothetical protein [Oscillospiraceae bacterium]